LLTYPWDCKPALNADDIWWQYVSHQYADTCSSIWPFRFFTDVDSSGISNGYEWYQVIGGRQDYMNYFNIAGKKLLKYLRIKALLLDYLPVLWEGNRRSFFNYIEQSLKGIRGYSYRSCTGKGIRAKVFISGHDIDSSEVYSGLPVGNYHRPNIGVFITLLFLHPVIRPKLL